MNLQHFWTIVWLRWRLQCNQLRKGGTANVVILGILAALAVVFSVILFVGGIFTGMFALADASPAIMLLVWDGLAGAFLFFWLIGLVAELQRTDAFSLDKFLHLPITLTGVFVINYLSSLVRLSMIVFAPAMVGLSIGLVVSRGPAMLWLFPLTAAFFLMTTAITYQFQGWLASLMANPRRRRTIVVTATLMIVLLAQMPNLVNLWVTQSYKADPPKVVVPENKTEPTNHEPNDPSKILAEKAHEITEKIDSVGQTAKLISAIVPPGWLPIGAMSASEGGMLIPFASTLGLTLIGMASLWRAYNTTLRIYTGKFSSKPGKAVTAVRVAQPWNGKPGMLEERIPIVSERTAAVALAAFRSVLRAPEAKLLLLSPVILVAVFGSMVFTHGSTMSPLVYSFLPYGAMSMTLLGLMQLVGNQFGFDRGGYRVFVLSPAPRRDILLGKNLSVAPFALGIGWIMILLIEVVRPIPIQQVLSMVPQSVSMFLIFCVLANWLSILSPMPIKAGSLQPSRPKFVNMLIQFLFVLVFPIAMSAALIPLILEMVLSSQSSFSNVPVCLILSVIEFAIVVVCYRALLTSQGDLLQSREQRILETVAAKAE